VSPTLRRVPALALFLGLVLGCQLGPPKYPDSAGQHTGISSDDSQASDDSAPQDDSASASQPFFQVNWAPAAVVLTITNAEPGDQFHFGLAQTAQCQQGCWTGEDCLYGLAPWSYCHPAGNEGVALVYGAEPDTLIEGQQTVFSHPNFVYVTTYIVTREQDGACWAFGEDPSYYASLGCSVP